MNILELLKEYEDNGISTDERVNELFDSIKFEFSQQVIDAGKDKYSIWAIVNRIIWHVDIETNGSEFKISNNTLSCYARLLILENIVPKSFFLIKSKKEI